MALILSQQACVLTPMEPWTRLAEASAGIWPETKIWPLARMAWDFLHSHHVSMVNVGVYGGLVGAVCQV